MEHQGDEDYYANNGGGKLLKLADDLGDNHEEKEEKGEDNTNKKEIEGELKSHERVCPLCNKKFSSGKAFGGHMSSKHVQQTKGQKNKSCSKKLTKRKYNYKSHENSVVGHDGLIDEFDEDNGDCYYAEKMGFQKKRFGFTCDYCDKDFPSKKSLFGHMRCHPDRPYRGMDRPDSSNLNTGDIKNSSMFSSNAAFDEELEEGRNQEKSNFGNHATIEAGVSSEALVHVDGTMEAGTSVATVAPVVDLAQDLAGLGWFRKGRRGENAIVNNNESDEDDDDKEEDSFEEHRMASHLLMHFHNSGGSKSNHDDGRVVAPEGMEHLLDFAKTCKNPRQNPRKGEGKIVEKYDQSSNGGDEVEEAGVKNEGKSIEILQNGNKDDDNSSHGTKSDDELVRKMHYARKGKGEIFEKKKIKRKYNNNGDKITMKKDKLSPSSVVLSDHNNVISPPSVAAPPPPPPPPPPAPRSGTENGKEFRCPHCGKIFPTHQALGGHKSSHNKFKMNIHNTIDDEVPPPPVGDNKSTPCSKGRRICKKMRKSATDGTMKARRLLEFDLNQMPQRES